MTDRQPIATIPHGGHIFDQYHIKDGPREYQCQDCGKTIESDDDDEVRSFYEEEACE